MKITSSEALVCSDFHIPTHSQIWVEKLRKYASENKVKTLVIAGDYWNFDKLSDFETKDKYTLSQEIKVGKTVMESLQSSFQRIVMVQGNHDIRMPRALKFGMTYKEWMDTVFDDIEVTDDDHVILMSNGIPFRIAHAGGYSKIKGRVATDLSHCLQTNILIGHSHNFCLTMNHTGIYIACDLGCMCAAEKVLYKRSKTNTYPDWDNAFVHIKQGKIKAITERTW